MNEQQQQQHQQIKSISINVKKIKNCLFLQFTLSLFILACVRWLLNWCLIDGDDD